MSHLPVNDDDTNILVHIYDPDEENMPSIKHSTALFAGLFLGLVFLSALLVATIIYCSRKQENAAAESQKAKKQKSHEDLKSNLYCKPWGAGEDVTEETIMTASSRNSSDLFLSGGLSSDSDDDGDVDEEMQMQQVSFNGDLEGETGPGQNKEKYGSSCPICNQEYESGQPVYESNNPQCGHQCHKVCMDKWLECQNSCPVCIQPFVLRSV